jgi:Leucine-rich repeat (LRR) protein
MNMSYNHLQSLPDTVLTLVNLTHLDLNQNRITEMVGIGNLVVLVELLLDNNVITEVPEEIGTCTKLRQLSLKNNKLTKDKLPSCLFTNTALLNLQLTSNVGLTKADCMQLEGVDVFLERCKSQRNKAISGGAMLSDDALFGLE